MLSSCMSNATNYSKAELPLRSEEQYLSISNTQWVTCSLPRRSSLNTTVVYHRRLRKVQQHPMRLSLPFRRTKSNILLRTPHPLDLEISHLLSQKSNPHPHPNLAVNWSPMYLQRLPLRNPITKPTSVFSDFTHRLGIFDGFHDPSTT